MSAPPGRANITINKLLDPTIPIVIGCQRIIQIGGGKKSPKTCITQASHYDKETNTTNVYSLTPGEEIQQKLESSTGNNVLGSLIASLKPPLLMSVELPSNGSQPTHVFDKLPPEIIDLIGQKLASNAEDAYRFALATKHVSTCMAGIIKTIQPNFFKDLLTDFFQSVEDENNSNKIELPMFFLTGQNTIAHIYIFLYSKYYPGGVVRLYKVTSYNIEDKSMTKNKRKDKTFTSIEQMVNYIITDCLNNIPTRNISIGTDNKSVNYNFDIIDRLSVSLTELKECNPELISQYEESRQKYNDFLGKINRFQTLFTMYDTHLKNSIISDHETYKNLKYSYNGKTDVMPYEEEVRFINSELERILSLKKTASKNIIENFKTISKTFRKEFKKIYKSYKGYFDQVQDLRESIILHGYDPCKDREMQNAVKVTKTAKVTKGVKTKRWRG